MRKGKADTITFKVDAALLGAIRRIPNRSAFIRAAILGALDGMCPLCQGSGVLSPDQKQHWDTFAADHRLRECGECHELHLVCLPRRRAALTDAKRRSRRRRR